jgi:hypothetical protein
VVKILQIINERISNSFQRIDSVEESLLAEAALRDVFDLFLTEVTFFGLGAVLAWGSYGGENNKEVEDGCSPTGKSTADGVCGLDVRDIGEDSI